MNQDKPEEGRVMNAKTRSVQAGILVLLNMLIFSCAKLTDPTSPEQNQSSSGAISG